MRGLELLDGGMLVELIGIVDPLERVARRFGAAHQQRAARLRPEVLAEVEIDHDRHAVRSVSAGRSRRREHLLAQ